MYDDGKDITMTLWILCSNQQICMHALTVSVSYNVIKMFVWNICTYRRGLDQTKLILMTLMTPYLPENVRQCKYYCMHSAYSSEVLLKKALASALKPLCWESVVPLKKTSHFPFTFGFKNAIPFFKKDVWSLLKTPWRLYIHFAELGDTVQQKNSVTNPLRFIFMAAR